MDEHLAQVANVLVTASRSNFFFIEQILRGIHPSDSCPSGALLSIVFRRKFKSPRAALHHGQITWHKIFNTTSGN